MHNVIVIGAGPAGLAAALAASQQGAKVLLLERGASLGGILNQCIHNGFGLHYFREELTGPEYAERFIRQLETSAITVETEATVLELLPGPGVTLLSPSLGYTRLAAGAVVLAMGCRERTRGAIGIPGTRPAGVFTAGAAQLYMNIEGWQVGRRAVILGSGDIGLIMARRLCLEGAEVAGVFEAMPYAGGLARNVAQCLDDFNIPLYLGNTVTKISGDKRVEGVTVQRVDGQRRPVSGTERYIPCDTVLLSVGLIPENELSRTAGIRIEPATGGPLLYENMETSLPGVFACGNVAHVHDLVDYVTTEGQRAGAAAAQSALGKSTAPTCGPVCLQAGKGIRYVLPQMARLDKTGKEIELFFRVDAIYREASILVGSGDAVLLRQRRVHMAPGEMQTLRLTKTLLAAAKKDITISVERGVVK